MDIDELRTRIKSFSELENNWDSYGAEKITKQSITTALHMLSPFFYRALSVNKSISVFPMRDGGIQFEIGDYKEIEILNHEINEIDFDSESNIINRVNSTWGEDATELPI
jgi:hypothetical protein